MTRLGRGLCLACALLLGTLPSTAFAHESRLATLHLTEVGVGDWVAARQGPARVASLPAWPVLGTGCAWTGADAPVRRTFHCQAGHTPTPVLRGATRTPLDIFVSLEPQRGETRTRLVAGGIGHLFPEGEKSRLLPLDYGPLGVRHVLAGFDHLLFLLVLVLALRRLRPLLTATAGFTLGHAVTLSLAALGHVSLPTSAVEALIAASIVITAAAVLRDPDGELGGHPLVLPGILGAVHGLGFAGALALLGLPESGRLLALVSFNLGVELAQAAIVAGLFAMTALHARRFESHRWVRPLGYAAGIAGALLFWGRLLDAVTRA